MRYVSRNRKNKTSNRRRVFGLVSLPILCFFFFPSPALLRVITFTAIDFNQTSFAIKD